MRSGGKRRCRTGRARGRSKERGTLKGGGSYRGSGRGRAVGGGGKRRGSGKGGVPLYSNSRVARVFSNDRKMGSARVPFGLRSGSVWSPFGVRVRSVQDPYGVHTGSVRDPYWSGRDPYGLRTVSYGSETGVKRLGLRIIISEIKIRKTEN